jgi:hypothetical protein
MKMNIWEKIPKTFSMSNKGHHFLNLAQLNASICFQLIFLTNLASILSSLCKTRERTSVQSRRIRNQRTSTMMVRMRVVLLLLTSVTASRKLNGVEVQNSNNTLEERYAEAEAIVKNFVNQAKEESHTQLPTDRGEYQLSTNDEPASHDLHMDSTASQALLERKREGTTKIGKKDSKDKGDKAKAEKTGKGAKVKKGPGSGKSNSKNRAADEPTGAPSTTPSPTTTHRPTASTSPSAAPSITSSPTTTHRPTASTSPSVAPSYPPSKFLFLSSGSTRESTSNIYASQVQLQQLLKETRAKLSRMCRV